MEMKKAMQPAISKEELGEHIERTREKFRRITQAYKNGYISENERFHSFDTGILEGFFRYLESKGLKGLPYIRANWQRFLEDYNLYQNDMEPNSSIEEPWLRYYDQSDHKTVYEANITDKANFFMLMEEFRIPVEYFEPLPEHCTVSDRTPGHLTPGEEIDQPYDLQREVTKKLIDYYERQAV